MALNHSFYYNNTQLNSDLTDLICNYMNQVDFKISDINSKLTMTNKTLWTGSVLLCEGKKRTLRMDGAPVASKITLGTSDRPIVDMTGAILTTTGGASILRVRTTGALEFSNLSGNVNNGSAFGSINWYVA